MTLPSVRFVHPSTRSLRVLIADDNRDAADSLAELLELAGCDVKTCYNGGEVVPLAEDFRPDVCILDLWMPVMSGWEVAEKLRIWADGQLLLLIALTGLGGKKSEDRSTDAGFDHHIVKPSDPQEIFSDLAAFIVRMEGAISSISC
jgi:CheY-like chemotaxis protein